jgi:hypothetical protein
MVRADPEGQNKGGGAAAAALHLIALARRWGRADRASGFRPQAEIRSHSPEIPRGRDTRMSKSPSRHAARCARGAALCGAGPVSDGSLGSADWRLCAVSSRPTALVPAPTEEMPGGRYPPVPQASETRWNWQAAIDQMTDRALVAKWPIARIDPDAAGAVSRGRGGTAAQRHAAAGGDFEFVEIRAGLLSRRARGEIRQCRARPHGARGRPEEF